MNGHLHTHLHLGILSTGEMDRPNAAAVTQISVIKICIVLTSCKINSKTELHLKPVFWLKYRMFNQCECGRSHCPTFSHFQLTKEGLINIFRIQSTKKQNKLHAW